MKPHPRTPCPVCGRAITNHNYARHVRSHEDQRDRMVVPPAEQEQMVRLYRSGQSREAIGRTMFYGTSTVGRVLLAHGISSRPPGGRRPYLPADELLKRCELYGRGYSIKEVAELCGVSYTAIQHTLRNAGVKVRPPGHNLRWQRQRRSERQVAA